MLRLFILLMTILFFSQASFSEDLSDFQNVASSPNGKLIAIVKPTKNPIPDSCSTRNNSDSDAAIDPDTGQPIDTAKDKNTDYAQQIWIYDVKSKKQKVLVHSNFSCNDPEKQILDPQELKFSPDGKKLYFMTTGWVTSAALHVVNVDGKHEHYLIPTNDYSIIPKGQYKGYIIAWQHRYFVAPGSYNWYSLYSPSGKKIGSLGKEVTKDQMDYLESK